MVICANPGNHDRRNLHGRYSRTISLSANPPALRYSPVCAVKPIARGAVVASKHESARSVSSARQ